jgi:hypothetical protein
MTCDTSGMMPRPLENVAAAFENVPAALENVAPACENAASTLRDYAMPFANDGTRFVKESVATPE